MISLRFGAAYHNYYCLQNCTSKLAMPYTKRRRRCDTYLWWRARWPWDSCTLRSRRAAPWASRLAPGRCGCGPWRRRLGRRPWARRAGRRRLAEARRAEAWNTATRSARTAHSTPASAAPPGPSPGQRQSAHQKLQNCLHNLLCANEILR